MFNFLAVLDIRVFGRLRITIVASDWPQTFLQPGCFSLALSIYCSCKILSSEQRFITKEQIATHTNLILPLYTPVL